MKLKEAYQILNLPENSTVEEVKKRYKELAKKHHPDIDKSPDAGDKFKQINSANERIMSGKPDEPNFQSAGWEGGFPGGMGGFDISDFFGNNNRKKNHNPQNIETHINISFKQSVFGSDQKIQFKRQVPCKDCDAQGKIPLDNGCKECGGKGQRVQQHGHTIMVMQCGKCYGKTKTKDCEPCKSKGTLTSDLELNIKIPGGVQNGNILRLENMGNYMNSFGPMEQFTDAFVHINVTPLEGFTLNDKNVETKLNLTLLEALKGCKKTIQTLEGDQEIEVKPKFKNSETISLPYLGVNKRGDQVVHVNIDYPDDVDSLIKTLES